MNRTKLGLFISVLILITGILNVNADAFTLVSPSNISGGQMFDVSVIIDPNGTAITGAQLDLEFNKSSIIINSITEGNLLKQSGINTIFNSGSISNSQGKVEKIYGAILGPKNVTTSGTFIIINATAIVSTNTPEMNLMNFLVVDPQGEQIFPIPTPKPTIPTEVTSMAKGEDIYNGTTFLIAAFAGIIIIPILVYKYVAPKYSASKGNSLNVEKKSRLQKQPGKN